MGRIDSETEEQIIQNLDFLMDMEALENEDNWEVLDSYEDAAQLDASGAEEGEES